MKELTLKHYVEWAKKLTKEYAKTHKGRNDLEKECIKKGYLVNKLGEMYSSVLPSEKDNLGIFALDKSSGFKGGFTYIR